MNKKCLKVEMAKGHMKNYLNHLPSGNCKHNINKSQIMEMVLTRTWGQEFSSSSGGNVNRAIYFGKTICKHVLKVGTELLNDP